jgi:hypothetical protein
MRYEHCASDPHGFKRNEIAVWNRVYRGKTAFLMAIRPLLRKALAAQTTRNEGDSSSSTTL